ncbi:expressed protein [Chlorella variabilis]|uniref:Expressed protein n=1 Tax=Chlorella variabilis TaxID=554065 RepID=E1Z4B4_CHLVA|nr:expressed protein [Chlorella variabilis]EFN59024.1 expressed protein [Chlorella variabilis]|eukprot:XP_005851126.1 expressed protein [Chlorella variabilis]
MQQGGASLARLPSAGRNMDQPFTFTSPFTAAEELRQAGAAPAGSVQGGSEDGELDGGSRRPSGVLRSAGSDPNRMRRNISWPDFENQAPLAQVVEYEPSDRHSARSEDDWGSPRSSGCMCCIQ